MYFLSSLSLCFISISINLSVFYLFHQFLFLSGSFCFLSPFQKSHWARCILSSICSYDRQRLLRLCRNLSKIASTIWIVSITIRQNALLEHLVKPSSEKIQPFSYFPFGQVKETGSCFTLPMLICTLVQASPEWHKESRRRRARGKRCFSTRENKENIQAAG